MANKYFILGGKQKETAASLPEWYSTDEAVIYEIDIDTEIAKQVFSYKGQPDYMANEESSITFKSGYFDKDALLLYTCTLTEVLIISVPGYEIVKHISLPCFNDLHYVRPFNKNTILVVSTGLDLLLELDLEGNILNEWPALDEDIWKRFDKTIDYRKVPTTKPHHSHPNFVSLVGDELWLTRFEQKDAVCLNKDKEPIKIDVERPHDGLLYQSLLYYTTVNGYVVVADPMDSRVTSVVDLNSIDNPFHLSLGWCRGISMISEDLAIVGFTTIRKTKFKDNLNWLTVAKSNLKRLAKKKTRIAIYNLREKTLLKEINLEGDGLNVLFSVLPV